MNGRFPLFPSSGYPSKGNQSQLIRVWLWSVLSIALATLALPGHTRAQGTDTALLRGTVTDSSGGVIPAATVTMTNDGTKVSERKLTDTAGRYIFNALKPASYTAT